MQETTYSVSYRLGAFRENNGFIEVFLVVNPIINDIAIIPLVYRPRTAGIVNNLVSPLSGWDNDLWLLKDWYKTT